MKVSGRIIFTMEEESSIMPVEISTKESLLMTWLKDLGSTNMPMVQSTWDTGTKINNMDSVRKNGMMEVSTKVTTRMLPKKAKANIAGLMVTGMLENGKTICSMDVVFLSGMMIDSSLGSGKTI